VYNTYLLQKLGLHSFDVVVLLLRFLLNPQVPIIISFSITFRNIVIKMVTTFISFLPLFLHLPSHYYPLGFRFISSHNKHHQFNFKYGLFLFGSQDMMLHILQREAKQIIFLTCLNFIILSTWSNLSAGMIARSPLILKKN